MDRNFTVVLRGPAAALFLPGETLRVEAFASAIGPVDVVFGSRWIQKSPTVTIPGDLWVEVVGSGPSLEASLVPFANAGMALLPVLALSANAAVKDPQVEVAFDSTVGVSERDYFQSYVPGESGIVHFSRRVRREAVVALLEALGVSAESKRLRRAIGQYRMALDWWRQGLETLALAHLWMAVEALTKAKIRAECGARGLSTPQELAGSLGVPLCGLDAAVRATLLLHGDAECYGKAKEASDGFEHGFLEFPTISALAKDVRHRMAAHVRSAILELCGVTGEALATLTGPPYDKPLGYWPPAKYLRARLVGDAPQLAAEGKEYPFLTWEPKTDECSVDAEGNVQLKFSEQLTQDVAEGMGFRDIRYEVWRPG
jgi:hypothetical protein